MPRTRHQVQVSLLVETSLTYASFRKLNEFQHFEGPPVDPLGEDSQPIAKIREAFQLQKQTASTVALSIEQSRLIQNIIYLRDPQILENLDKTITQLSQRDVFQHENLLDVKKLITENEISSRMNEQLFEALSRAKRQKPQS